MPLTPIQRKALIRYNDLRNRPVTFGEIFLKSLPSALIFVVIALFAAVARVPMLACFAAGMAAGLMLQFVALGRRTAQIMPALVAVIDWNKVAALLGESAPPHPAGPIDGAGPPPLT